MFEDQTNQIQALENMLRHVQGEEIGYVFNVLAGKLDEIQRAIKSSSNSDKNHHNMFGSMKDVPQYSTKEQQQEAGVFSC